MAAELATSVALTIFDHSLGAIVRQVGYLWNHRKNLADLETHVKKLDDVRNDKNHSVLVARRNAERIRSQVESWQNDVDKISLEARNIMELYEENAKHRCLIGLCPNVVSHYRLSRKACKKQLEILEAVKEANQFNGVADRPVRRALSLAFAEGFLAFDSRNSTLEEIMKILKDTTKSSIGVYGFGGMGKTTLAKQVASRAAEEKLFDEIVMAPVTQTPEVIEIQGHMAKKLDLKLEESSVAERAGRIHERLKKSKVLVILDDLWEKLDLEKVGIPFGNEHLGCKILLTSRFQSVLSIMGTKKDFPLDALKEEEAWRLFEEKTTDVVKDLAFLDIGKKVAKRCAGLPVLIVTVAASLSSRPSLPAWKDALKELKKMNNREVHEIVNSAMEYISYKHLQETHKRLFLICGLLGSSSSIEYLLKIIWGWNLFDEDVVTLEEARNKLHAFILNLKASCLLLDGDNEDIIKMHDVVRGVAISLARKNHNMLSVRDGDTEMIRWPADDVLRSCTAMVFDDCRDVSCLPERLECLQLEFFYLRGISLDASSTIPDTFFQKTRKLKVLDMTQLCFSGLPSSLSCLENLQTLCLDQCTNLKDISIVRELKKLQVLSFRDSDIEELPRGIGQLSELRLLDLTGCSKLEIILAGLLAGLSKLEELYMRQSFKRWEAEGFHSNNSERSSNVSLAELKRLPKLRNLEIEVEDAKLLSEDLNFERLERYRIIAGDMYLAEEIDKKGISRKLGMNLVTIGINHLQNGVKGLLKRTECLYLRELKGINNIVHELDGDGFIDLKHLSIQMDYDIQFIVSVERNQQRAFPSLESLHLDELLKLEKICNGWLMQDSFCKLTTMNVVKCNKLESLFSFSMATSLPCLQELQVSDCRILKGIVAKKSDEDYNDATSEKIEFVRLRKLSVEGLPQLMSFCCSVKEKQKYMKTSVQSSEIISEEEEPSSSMSFFKEANFPSLEELSVKNCKGLKYLFTPSVTMGLVRLQHITIENCPMMKKIVVNEEGETTTNISFENLSEMEVNECESLKYVFPACVAQRLHQLERLSIWDCAGLETIVEDEGDENKEVSPTFIFPKLRELYIANLPKVECFYPKKHASEWPMLNGLMVHDCGKISILELLHFSGKQQHNQFQKLLSHLESVAIRSKDMKMLARQYGDFPSSKVFLKLRDLTITEFDDGDDSSTVFPSNFLYRLNNLESLTIENSSFEEIFPYEGEGEEPSLQQLLPRLNQLILSNLPELKYICTENSPFFPMLDKLKQLHVVLCPDLTNLVPTASPSFKFLVELALWGSDGLIYLLSSSAAASMENLTRLDISRCEMIKEIVAADHHSLSHSQSQQDEIIIIFSQLKYLRLEKLPRLTSFCTANNYTFNFPALDTVLAIECPNMRTFSPGITITPMLRKVAIEWSNDKQQHWKGDLNTTIQHIFSESWESQRLTTTDPSTSSNNHVEPEAQSHEKPTETDICEEVVVEEGKEADSCDKGKGKQLEICEEKVLESAGNEGQISNMSITQHGESSLSGPSRSLAFEIKEQANAESLAPQDVVASSSQLTPTSDHLETSPSLLASASYSQQKDVEGLPVTKHFIPLLSQVLQILQPQQLNSMSAEHVQFMECLNTIIQLLSSEMEVQRLAITGPSTSSNNHFEPEAKQTESAGKELKETCEEFSEPRKEGQVCKKLGKKTEISMKATKTVMKRRLVRMSLSQKKKLKFPRAAKPSKESEVYENVIVPRDGVDICEKGKGKGKEIEVYEEVETWNHPCLESNISEKFHSDSSLHSLTKEPEEQNALSREANSRPNDLQGFRVTKDFITLFGKVLQILQTQPQKDLGAEQVQFMEDASRDLSSMNFPTEWLLPYLEKARKCLSVVERTKVISKLELEIAEIEAQLQAKKVNKKALEEENVAVASNMDLDKPLYDD